MLCKRRIVLASLTGLLMFGGLPLRSEEAGVLLRILPQKGPEVVLDRAALEHLPQVSFDTTTIWTEGLITFSGPRLRDVLAQAGIGKGRVLLKALNEYEAEMDFDEMGDDWPIIATRQNGQPFDVRNQGPLWVVYPYDGDISLSPERAHALSVWQLVQVLDVTP